jgi:DNA end-binding protein Ku
MCCGPGGLQHICLQQRQVNDMATSSRPIASLSISFGLVAIPVKLYSAVVASERLAFHLLRKSDGSRIKEQFVAVNDGKQVERADMVKGYEFSKGKHVAFTVDELKVLEDATSPALDIVQFVPLESVDPVYFMATYYLLPDKGGAKPYALLSTALSEERQCAVGKWTSRGKEHVIIIRPAGKGLALHQLHFGAEVRDLEDLGYEPATVTQPEVKLARQLIEHLSAQRFDPNEFADEHRARVLQEIKKKIQGKDISASEEPARKPRDNVVNIMDALKASLKKKSAANGSTGKVPGKANAANRRRRASK